jgi:hypothetical protein
MLVQMSRLILLILLIAAAAVIGAAMVGSAAHPRDAAIAASIGLIAIVAGLLPVRFAADRSAINLFQSAWIGSILHLTAFIGLGGAIIFATKPSSAFVIWLLAMYWLTLIGLCSVMIKTLRSAAPQMPGALTTQQVIKGE